MWRNAFLLSTAAACGLVLCSCGKSPPPPPRSALVQGEGTTAGPVVAPEPDRGILQDPAQYQPATFTPPPSKAKDAGTAASKAADADTAAQRKFVAGVAENVFAGKFDLLLETIDPEQIKALREDGDFLAKTQEAYATLMKKLTDKLPPEAAEQVAAAVRKAASDSFQIETVSADEANVTPSPLNFVFGPAASAPAAKLVKIEGQWRFRLDAPLTAEDVEKIAEYHKMQQIGLAQAVAAFEKGDVDIQSLMAAMMPAGAPGGASPTAEAGSPPAATAPSAAEEPEIDIGAEPAKKGERPAP